MPDWAILSSEDLPAVDRDRFAAGVDQFNQQAFYQCHDSLEDLWHDALQPQRQFYQGVLQLAVGYYHLSNRNGKGAAILLGEGLAKLNYFMPTYGGIDVAALVALAEEHLAQVQSLLPDGLDRFVWHPIPIIQINVGYLKDS